jgi:hypothetical protein
MNSPEQIIDISGRRYAVRKMPTRGYLALMDALGRRPDALAAAVSPGQNASGQDMRAAMAPVLAELIDIVLAHCVRPGPDPDRLPPADARRLLSAARELNPLREIFEELNRFFEVLSPLMDEAAAAIPTAGSG